MRGEIHFAICTRDRPKTVVELLWDIEHASTQSIKNKRTDVYVFDDSRLNSNIEELRANLTRLSFKSVNIKHISKGYQVELTRNTNNEELRRAWNFSTKDLGEERWDLAGVRNLAFATLYAESKDQDLIIFLDDDIRLSRPGSRATNSSQLIESLNSSIERNTASVCGVSYLGRGDHSIVGHLSEIAHYLSGLAELNREQTSLNIELFLGEFPGNFHPIERTSGLPHLGEGPGGISGAVFATTRRTLGLCSMPKFYNEDWIWLLHIKHLGAEIKHIEVPAFHLPKAPLHFLIDLVLLQEKGEIVYYALRSLKNLVSVRREDLKIALEKGHRHELLKLQECLSIYRKLIAKHEQCTGENSKILQSVMRGLDDIYRLAKAIDRKALEADFYNYFISQQPWKKLLAYLAGYNSKENDFF